MTWARRLHNTSLLAAEVLADLAGILSSFFLAHVAYARSVGPSAEFDNKVPQIILIAAICILIFRLNGLYRKQKSILNIEETRLILKSVIIASMVTFALFELTRAIRNPLPEALPQELVHWHERVAAQGFGEVFSRLEILCAFGLMFPVLGVLRYLIFKGEQSLHRRGVGQDRVLIVGGGDLARRLLDKIRQSPKSGYFPVGRLGDGPPLEDLRDLGGPEDVEEVCRRFEINRLIIADPAITPDRTVELLQRAQSLGIALEFVPALHSLFAHRVRFSDIDGLPLIAVTSLSRSLSRRAGKRLFDLAVGGILFLLSLPVLVLAIICVKLNDPGAAVFFTQRRTGRGGKPFAMYKIRTMRPDTAAEALTPGSSADPRITTPGRWLRRFSFDELPQLVNVLKGEMSLVGPRPEMAFITEQYGPRERERLSVKPGLTGLWQISADRRLQIHENLDYDLYYIEHQGLLLDCVILLRTAASVLRGQGAW